MIENRHRIENEVLLGRQAVRRALQNKEKSREAAKPQPGPTPQPITGTQPSQDGTDTGPVPTTSEAPMSMDTDAEDAFKKGSPWFFKRDTSKSGSSTPRHTGIELRDSKHTNGAVSQPPLTWRNSWTSSLFSNPGTEKPPTTPQPTALEPTQQPGETASQNLVPPPSPSLFNRIRRRSTFSSSFSTLRRAAAGVGSRPTSEYGAGDAQESWSSDSSSEEDLPSPSPEWRTPKRQQFPSLVNFEDVDDAPTLSSGDDTDSNDREAAAEGADSDSR